MDKREKLCVIILLILATGALGFLPFSNLPGQPIDFSHRIHAGINHIPCQYCHTGARRSPVAGIPAVDRCMGCHKVIAVNKPEVSKLKDYYERSEPIPWVRFFLLPDFVFFNHEPHVRAAVKCQTCHGEVEKIDRFREIPVLEMGWCLKCHKEMKAPTDCLICHR